MAETIIIPWHKLPAWAKQAQKEGREVLVRQVRGWGQGATRYVWAVQGHYPNQPERYHRVKRDGTVLYSLQFPNHWSRVLSSDITVPEGL